MSSSVRDRALSILELLVKHVGGLPMSEIADQLGIPRTATHRLLGELKDMGYVKQNSATTHYLLTVKLASLGLTYLASSGIIDATQPLLDDLAAKNWDAARLSGYHQQLARAVNLDLNGVDNACDALHVLTDFVSGMTDRYAVKTAEMLYSR